MPRVAYQGEPGAFSQDAARTLVDAAETHGCATFDEAFAAVEDGTTDFALLPVENSISGSVPRVYDLLWDAPTIHVVDEIVYRVVQNVIAIPGATLAGLREVRSHPVALEQCRRFLGTHRSLRVAIVADTGGAVREIMTLRDPTIAAIASSLAAQHYGARVLAAGVQDVEANFTRFFLVGPGAARAHEPQRACVALVLANRPGALRDALSAFADRDLDLRTVVTRPSLDEPFTYRFYCEIARAARPQLEDALGAIGGTARLLGYY